MIKKLLGLVVVGLFGLFVGVGSVEAIPFGCNPALNPNACGVGICCSSFLAETEIIMADGSVKNIELVVEGDEVVSFDEQGVRMSKDVVLVNKKGKQEGYYVVVAGNREVKATRNHPFFVPMSYRSWDVNVPDGYKRTDELRVGEWVYVEAGGEMEVERITEIMRIDEEVEVYTLTVEGNSNYFANGYAVHNKFCYTCGGGAAPPCDPDLWGACSVSCGGGIQTNDCGDVRACNTQPCCNRYLWYPWSVCSVSCGGGLQWRVNDCGTWQSQSCNTQPCCDPSSWGSWGACSVSCGGGVQWRVNNCGTWQSQSCNTQPCCTESNPAAPTLSAPQNGLIVDTTEVSLNWNHSNWGTACPSNSNSYQVYVSTSPDANVLRGTVSSSTHSLVFNGNYGQTYYWRVVADNSDRSTSSPTWSFQLLASVSGTIFNDPENVCSSLNPSELGTGTKVSLRNTGYESDVASSGTYKVYAPVGLYGYLDVVDLPEDYICSTGCLQGCPTATSILSPSTGRNYYFTQKRDPWWQVEDAGVYAGSDSAGTTIRSLIPDTISESQRYLVLAPGGSDAAVIRNKGNVSLGSGNTSVNRYLALSKYQGEILNFSYWRVEIGVENDPSNDFANDNLEKPTYNPDKDYYFMSPSGGVARIETNWLVNAGESYVVMVDGDLEINANVEVGVGGFLVAIVSGDIYVDPGVSRLQGIYVMDGNFITESQYVKNVQIDERLFIEGTVVAWGAIEFRRDLGVGNVEYPSETVKYRADLIANMPEKMRSFIVRWREVPAGTFDK